MFSCSQSDKLCLIPSAYVLVVEAAIPDSRKLSTALSNVARSSLVVLSAGFHLRGGRRGRSPLLDRILPPLKIYTFMNEMTCVYLQRT